MEVSVNDIHAAYDEMQAMTNTQKIARMQQLLRAFNRAEKAAKKTTIANFYEAAVLSNKAKNCQVKLEIWTKAGAIDVGRVHVMW